MEFFTQFMSSHMYIFTFFLLNLSLVAALPQTAAPLIQGKPFSVIWNGPVARCKQLKSPLDLDAFQVISTPQLMPNQFLTLMYDQKLGLFPYVKNFTEYYGGIPQKGNLNASLEKSKQVFQQFISDSSNGLAVLDWEEWFPLYERNVNARQIYKKLSINYTLQQEPSLTHSQAVQKAREQFNKAAQSFMEETLKLGLSLRPQSLWGYYLFPSCFNYDYTSSKYTGKCPASALKLNNQLQWLWNISTALFPSAYTPKSLSGTYKIALFVRNQMLEALRVSALSQKSYTTPVYLYLRPIRRDPKVYHQTARDLMHSIGESAALGAAGCVLWGASADFRDTASCTSAAAYLSHTLSPYVVNVTTAAQLCSNRLCHGMGRCVRKHSHANDYLHLNPKSFKIVKMDGKYQTTGQLDSADLNDWAKKFTCQCYKDQDCTGAPQPVIPL